MSTAILATVIAAVGVIISVLTTLAIVSYKIGGASNRLTTVENNMSNMATREQLSSVKEDIAEIKGMFRMTLKE